jgi:HK97 family phage prohead protease
MSKHKQEIRTLSAKELRIAPIAADGTRTLSGRAIVFDVRSQDLGGFQEIVSAGSVTETLSGSPSILLLNNHNSSEVLGSTRSGTLQLITDAKGVAFSCALDMRCSYASDLAISVERGDTAGCSFGFRTLKDSYANENGTLVRTLEAIQISELSVCATPAYLQTRVDVRSRNIPKELRALLRSADDDEDEDDDCDCERNPDGSLVDPECTCDEDDDEDRSILSKSEVHRLEMRLALASLR